MARGQRIRLVAEAELINGMPCAQVSPRLLDERDSLATLSGSFNEITIEGEGFTSLTLRGPGAGGIETATAILADVRALTWHTPLAAN
jgi:homoserine dehydrogenase